MRSRWTRSLLGLRTHDRRNAQLEFLNRFDWALLFICQKYVMKITDGRLLDLEKSTGAYGARTRNLRRDRAAL
jgi:hypothetical protein